jgi:hypothetical protein
LFSPLAALYPLPLPSLRRAACQNLSRSRVVELVALLKLLNFSVQKGLMPTCHEFLRVDCMDHIGEILAGERAKMDQINTLKSSEGAVQMLVWAIEEIVKVGNEKAEHHARLALKYLLLQIQTPM